MRLLEHEAKNILKNYMIPVPYGRLITPTDRVMVTKPVMLKAQVPIGGRGKAGGILRAGTTEEAKTQIATIFSTRIRGFKANKILMEEEIDVAQEFFMAITYDTVAKAPVVLFSPEGGVDVEKLAARCPEEIIKEYFLVRSGLLEYRSREIISQSGISGKLLLRLGSILSSLARVFLDYDATIAEINPLALTTHNQILALDCHLEIEDEALFRHKNIAEKEKDESRVEGGKISTAFERKGAEIDNLDHRGVAGRIIEFDGTMGLIIGGGGASLAAFDAVKAHGGRPVNYCEIGGNPSVLKVKELTKLILSKPNVQKISVIMNVVSNTRVDLVARGVIKGILESGKVPSETVSIFRIPGAWEKEGFKILSKYGVTYCDRTVSIDEAARIAVEKMTH